VKTRSSGPKRRISAKRQAWSTAVDELLADAGAEGQQVPPGRHAAARGALPEAEDGAQLRQRRHAQGARPPARDLRVVREQVLEEAVAQQLRLHQQHRRVAVAQHVIELRAAREGVHRHDDAAEHAHGVGGDDPLGAVRDLERHARALHHARTDEPARHGPHLALELAVGPVAALEVDRPAVGVPRGDVGEEAPEREPGIARVHRAVLPAGRNLKI
jgi:hypothetical protein